MNERMKAILPYIKNKDVLDIGCYAETNDRTSDEWIHGFLTENAKEVIGIDIVKEQVESMQKEGYKVYCQSAENFYFDRKFDVIVAGAVIEHLSNPGLFLDCVSKHLKQDGMLIVDTNNVFSINYKIGGLLRFFNNDLSIHWEHTCFYSPTTIKNLLNRHGFATEKVTFVNFNPLNTLKAYTWELLCKIFGRKLKYEMVVFARLK